MLKKFCAAALFIALAAPAQGDDIQDSIAAALEAYQAGDIKTAKEEIDFAAQLLSQLKAEGLTGFLPAAMDGWTREDNSQDGQGMAAFGGGQMASATYSDGSNDVEIQIMADNQMVTAMGAMFSNAALMGAMGKVKRINRQKVVITPEGQINTLINNRIMVQISGSAPVEIKEAYFEGIDLPGLKEF